MNTTISERKAQAVKYLNELNVFKPYIKGFEEESKVCFFEGFGGFWVTPKSELHKKMKEIEAAHNCTVYAITHERTEFGECYSFLIVTDYKEEWDSLIEDYGEGKRLAFAYVWNKDDEWCSEFGTIAVQCFGGGITRIG